MINPSAGAKPLAPVMTVAERVLLREQLKHVKLMLEFGAGGSTALALEAGVERVISVESDPEWMANVKAAPEVAPAVAQGRVSILHVDIGPVGAWGHPIDAREQDRWPNYSVAPWTIATGNHIDFVLVDGRFRVACVTQAALRCPRARIAIHDFWNRPHYHVVLPMLEEVARVDTLGIFRVRPDLEQHIAEKLYTAYAFNPA